MDLKFKHINWVGNICQKFEAVCQEVDNVVSKNAVKYFESQVQNIGGNVEKIYSGVIQDLLPLPPLVNSENYLESQVQSVGGNVQKVYSGVVQQLLPLENEGSSSVKSVAVVEDISRKEDEVAPPNNFIESFQDSNAINLANDQQTGSPIEHDLVNQVSDETFSESVEMDDSHITQEEVGDYHSRETSGAKREMLDVTIEEISVEPAPQPMNLISVKEIEALEFSICSESYSGSSGSGCGVPIEKKHNFDVDVEPKSCPILKNNATNSSTVLNFMSPSEKESLKTSLFPEPSDVADDDTHGILAEVSPATSDASHERPITKTEPPCFKSSASSDSLDLRSLGSYSFEIESYKNNLGDAAWSISDSSLVHVYCEPSPLVAGQIMEPQSGLASSDHTQSMESKDESLVKSVENVLEDIKLNDDTKLGESCVFVDDSELHAVSRRVQKLRSYKKRIQDAFASKKRLAKEYEQLAIWYGDTDLEYGEGLSQTLLPFSSRTYVESKNLQGQDASETDWELL
ncbi:hypothetical protein TanjilG_29831 [Lupinus angustifolius]|uniref:Uncharacterized protein n=1 Tax=Lupinus angustifolius TaxID=3871 RepID=A0A4P1RAI1_LUPAN|nr:PREDICTED: uncharacterized protein LOC109355088 [Lupinus angustifolius]OIW06075.1 hypothetical protein TanjilG_29831 [Lupinus angustifolius]